MILQTGRKVWVTASSSSWMIVCNIWNIITWFINSYLLFSKVLWYMSQPHKTSTIWMRVIYWAFSPMIGFTSSVILGSIWKPILIDSLPSSLLRLHKLIIVPLCQTFSYIFEKNSIKLISLPIVLCNVIKKHCHCCKIRCTWNYL